MQKGIWGFVLMVNEALLFEEQDPEILTCPTLRRLRHDVRAPIARRFRLIQARSAGGSNFGSTTRRRGSGCAGHYGVACRAGHRHSYRHDKQRPPTEAAPLLLFAANTADHACKRPIESFTQRSPRTGIGISSSSRSMVSSSKIWRRRRAISSRFRSGHVSFRKNQPAT